MKVAYLCSSIQLQEQLHMEFPEAGYIVGRRNYNCLAGNDTASNCLHSGTEDPCDFRHSCPYQLAKKELLSNNVHIMNYDFFISACNYNEKEFGDYDLVVCDECDVLESKLTDFISFELSCSVVKKYGLSKPKLIGNTSDKTEQVWKDWSKNVLHKIKLTDIVELGYKTDTKEYKRAKMQKKNLIKSLSALTTDLSQNWIFDVKKHDNKFIGDSYTFKPVWITADMFEQYFGRHGNRFVFLSGSIPQDKIFAKALGQYESDIEMHRFSSDFDFSHSPIYKHYCGKMSMKEQENSLPEIIKTAKQICEDNPDHKILVHTVSYNLQEKIIHHFTLDRVVSHGVKDKDEKLRMWKESTKPLIFFSPVCSRGVDLPDDLCRVQIILKAPYLSLGDKFTKTRAFSSWEGREWYVSMCCQELMQMRGRGIRHKDDWCVTHVLDTDACELLDNKSYMFPEWFLKAVKYG